MKSEDCNGWASYGAGTRMQGLRPKKVGSRKMFDEDSAIRVEQIMEKTTIICKNLPMVFYFIIKNPSFSFQAQLLFYQRAQLSSSMDRCVKRWSVSRIFCAPRMSKVFIFWLCYHTACLRPCTPKIFYTIIRKPCGVCHWECVWKTGRWMSTKVIPTFLNRRLSSKLSPSMRTF